MDVKEKLFGYIELEEGVTPVEYDGTNVAFPEFDPGKQYGLWCSLVKCDSNERIMKMFEVMAQFIPVDLMRGVTVVHQFGIAENESVVQSIGWKYKPLMRDEGINEVKHLVENTDDEH